MYNLSEKQIADISGVIKNAGINYSHLPDDLLDHICCDIETQIGNGLDYRSAYNNVMNKIGFNGLKEIQEATIFYVKLNLMKMKKLMNWMGIVGGSLAAVGMLFKLWHLEGSNVLLIFGFLFLLLGFFPAALLSLRKDLGVKFFSSNFFIYVIGFITFVETGVAMLFKMMHWSGGGQMVTLSMILIFLVFYPLVFIKIIRTEQNRTVNLSIAIFSLFFIGFITVTNINSARKISNVYEYEDIVQETMYYKKNIQLLMPGNNLAKSNLSEINELNRELNSTINSYKFLILNGKKDIYELNSDLHHESLIEGAYDPRLIALKEKVEKYRQEALSLTRDNKEISDFVNMLLYTGEYKIGNFKNSWEERKFQRSYADMYTSLQQLEKNITQVEYEILRLLPVNNKTPE